MTMGGDVIAEATGAIVSVTRRSIKLQAGKAGSISSSRSVLRRMPVEKQSRGRFVDPAPAQGFLRGA